SRPQPAATLPPTAPKKQQATGATAQVPVGGGLDAITLSALPLSSIAAISPSVDPDPDASFRALIAPPAGPPPAETPVDPRMLRKIVDRGVVTFASSRTDADRAKGARLIQIAALVGFPPARGLLARNYPQSEAVRAAVPANDVIRYALDFFNDPAAANDDSARLLSVLAEHFSRRGDLDAFATQLLASLRRDARPHLSHRIDLLLEALAGVPGSCATLARLLAAPPEQPECSAPLAAGLQRYVETTATARADEEARQRGLQLLSQLDVH